MHPRTRIRALFASDDGTFNLSSIIIGAVLVLGLVAGLTVGLTRLLPWGQDMNAKEDLSAVRTAESVTRAKDGRFLDDAGLRAAGYLDVEDRAVVGTNSEGTCYVAIAKSRSGKFFFTTDTNSGYQELLATTSTGDCLPLVDEEQLRMVIGAPTQSFGPLENGSFEEGLTGWTAGSTTGGSPATVPAAADTYPTNRHDGARAAVLPAGSYIEQGIRVPVGAAEFSFYGRVISRFTNDPARVSVQVLNRSGDVLATIQTMDDINTTFRATRADLSAFAGQDVYVRILTPSGREFQIDTVAVSSSVPATPTLVTGYTRAQGATIIWENPGFGAASVTSYIVRAYQGSSEAARISVRPDATEASLTGLQNGSRYSFTVAAVNVLGSSPESARSDEYLVEPVDISNPSFEGKLSGWTLGSNAAGVSPSVVSNTSGHGKYRVAMASGQFIEQLITVPSDEGMVRLAMDVRAVGNMNNTSAAVDTVVATAEGQMIKTVQQDTTAGNGNTLKTLRTDLTEFRGQTVLLRFTPRPVSAASGVQIDNLRFESGPAVSPVVIAGWASDRTAHIRWEPPLYGLASVTGYKVTAYEGTVLAAERTITDPGATSFAFDGLDNGTVYKLSVSSINALGASPESAGWVITPTDHTVFNGGFEGGFQGWAVTDGNSPSLISNAGSAFSEGKWAAHLFPGGGSVQQTTTVPSGSGASLTLSAKVPGTQNGDVAPLIVEIRDAGGAVLEHKTVTVQRSFGTHTVDLSAYMGHQVDLRLAHGAAAGRTIYLDAVKVTVR